MVVGSMAPDFYYFALVPDVLRFGHTLKGLFVFCIPLGLALLWLFHSVLKKPLLALAPAHLRNRMSPETMKFSFWPASRMAWILISMVIGWMTHVAWDSFTHENGYITDHWLALQSRTIFWPHMHFFSSLQFLSSGLGLLLLGIAYLKWVKRTPVVERSVVSPIMPAARNVIVVAACLAAIVFGVMNGMQFAERYRHEWLRVFVVRTLVACITAAFVEIVLFAVYWHIAKDKPRKPSSGAGLRQPAYQD